MVATNLNRQENFSPQDGERADFLNPDIAANMTPEDLEALARKKRSTTARREVQEKIVSQSGQKSEADGSKSERVGTGSESPLVVKAKQMLNDFFQGKRSFEDMEIDEANAASIVKGLENQKLQ